MSAKYRSHLPQLSGEPFLTDGGIETTMIFQQGMDLPLFAAFKLLDSQRGKEVINQYFHDYCQLANRFNVGFILEAITWRASMDWATQLGYTEEMLIDALNQSIEMFKPFRAQYENEHTKILFSGCVGPRGDGYVANSMMSASEAEDYHSLQIETFSQTEADMITALTLNYVEEAIGITHAAKAVDMPVVISFTVETNGHLPTGDTLQYAIEEVEEHTNGAPAYYKINCAHPSHFRHVLSADEPWLQKIRSLRANASCLSHSELDEAEELDEGNPAELAQLYKDLMSILPNLNVLGGCCGTDHRHIEKICKICFDS